MRGDYWRRVLESGGELPEGRRLGDLTQELFEMLGDPDPDVRDDLACAVLTRWIRDGAYDDLLSGLGDGAAAGLTYRLGGDGDDSVFRRSYSARVLAETIARDNAHGLASREQVLMWGDRAAGWYTREKDLRGFVPGKGWAHAAAHGADLLACLARSPYLGPKELTVLLDVVADRLLAPTAHRLLHAEPDRIALAVMSVLHRDLVPQSVLDPWVARLVAHLRPADPLGPPREPQPPSAFNTEAVLRALHLQLVTGVRAQRPEDEALFAQHPAVRADLVLTMIGALRAAAPWLYR